MKQTIIIKILLTFITAVKNLDVATSTDEQRDSLQNPVLDSHTFDSRKKIFELKLNENINVVREIFSKIQKLENRDLPDYKNLVLEVEKQIEVMRNFFSQELKDFYTKSTDEESLELIIEDKLNDISVLLYPPRGDQEDPLTKENFIQRLEELLKSIKIFFDERFKFGSPQTPTHVKDIKSEEPSTIQNDSHSMQDIDSNIDIPLSTVTDPQQKLKQKDDVAQTEMLTDLDSTSHHNILPDLNDLPVSSYQGDEPVFSEQLDSNFLISDSEKIEHEMTFEKYLDKLKMEFAKLLDDNNLDESKEKEIEKSIEEKLKVVRDFFLEHSDKLTFYSSGEEDLKSSIKKQLDNINSFIEEYFINDINKPFEETDFLKIINDQIEDIKLFFKKNFKSSQPSIKLSGNGGTLHSSSKNVSNVSSPAYDSGFQTLRPEITDLKKTLEKKHEQEQSGLSENDNKNLTAHGSQDLSSIQGDEASISQDKESISQIPQSMKKEYKSASEKQQFVSTNTLSPQSNSSSVPEHSDIDADSSSLSQNDKGKLSSKKKKNFSTAKTAAFKDNILNKKTKKHSPKHERSFQNNKHKYNSQKENPQISKASDIRVSKQPNQINQMGDDPNLSLRNISFEKTHTPAVTHKHKVCTIKNNKALMGSSQELVVGGNDRGLFFKKDPKNSELRPIDGIISYDNKEKVVNDELAKKNFDDKSQIYRTKVVEGNSHNFAQNRDFFNDLRSQVKQSQNYVGLTFTVSRSNNN
ncbi:hypothetical protein NBO_490g0002 [Nosema bombycis CQ1]|uniref:Uncharacterized protein n=1 Tax=Nosema bombycis (strain CQ1 / CVCC 102059) TaxID=578461 RepID=R0MDT6_NOSB1|nr:hypothetical protein NBO_490g0002 [Nosema bombycis CQ1]|eukprot:EOB12245.1 hypothetical protein NBO_490g0002 [Nosema bombycis CQ1]